MTDEKIEQKSDDENTEGEEVEGHTFTKGEGRHSQGEGKHSQGEGKHSQGEGKHSQGEGRVG